MGKTANFLHFFVDEVFRKLLCNISTLSKSAKFPEFYDILTFKNIFLPFLYFFKTLKPNAARMAQNMGKIFLSTCFSLEFYLVVKKFTLLNSTAFFYKVYDDKVLRQNVASHNVYVTKRNITKLKSF